MCNFTPSAQMSLKTVLAVGELVQAASHAHGVTGPVQFAICRPPTDADLDRMADLYEDASWCGVEDDYVDMDETLSDEPDLQTIDTMTIDELDALDFPAEYLGDTEAFDE